MHRHPFQSIGAICVLVAASLLAGAQTGFAETCLLTGAGEWTGICNYRERASDLGL